MQSCYRKGFLGIIGSTPCARAKIESDCVRGTVSFYGTRRGVLVVTEAENLPKNNGVFAIHIHEGEDCSGTADNPFSGAGGHFDKCGREHPFHSGDLPPLFSNGGYAFSAVLTDRFSINDIIGKTVIIHAGADDFKSQPAGGAGERIACGVILRCDGNGGK